MNVSWVKVGENYRFFVPFELVGLRQGRSAYTTWRFIVWLHPFGDKIWQRPNVKIIPQTPIPFECPTYTLLAAKKHSTATMNFQYCCSTSFTSTG